MTKCLECSNKIGFSNTGVHYYNCPFLKEWVGRSGWDFDLYFLDCDSLVQQSAVAFHLIFDELYIAPQQFEVKS